MADTTEKLNTAIATLQAKVDKLRKEKSAVADRLQKAADTDDQKAVDECNKDNERLSRELVPAKELLERTTKTRDHYVKEKRDLAELKVRDRAEYDRKKALLKANLKVTLETSRKKVQNKVEKLTAQQKALETELYDLMMEVQKAQETDKKKKQEQYDKKSPALRTSLNDVKSRLPDARKRLAELEDAFAKADKEAERHTSAREKKLALITADMAEPDRKRLLREVKDMDEAHERNYATLLKSFGVEK